MIAERFLERLSAAGADPAVHEVHRDRLVTVSGTELLGRIASVRGWLRERTLRAGDRVAWVAANGADWIALDLALLAEGLVSVPWYTRQDPAELASYGSDCQASLILVGTPDLADRLRPHAPCPVFLLSEARGSPVTDPPVSRRESDALTIVYTSGTTGTAKGAILTEANLGFMLPVTAGALERMMGSGAADHRVFHYLPLCFLGSRVVLWTCLFRGNPIHLSTNLDDLAQELATARPNYVLNVPLLLERMRSRVEAGIAGRPAPIRAIWAGAVRAAGGSRSLRDRLALAVAKRAIFPSIRQRLGPELRCLICGSAPLAASTQAWFGMLGLPVYQVYGLTETSAIVTMDVPPDAAPGTVGVPLDGVEVRIGDDQELQVRGPNVFPGYWGRDEDTRRAFTDDGWFRTGDQGVLDGGRLTISGRVKNVLVLASGHKVAPEPIEEQLKAELPAADQIVVLGHDRKALVALVAGAVDRPLVDAAIARVNAGLPHYRRIAGVHVHPAALTPESGMLTANAKLKRAAIEAGFRAELEGLWP